MRETDGGAERAGAAPGRGPWRPRSPLGRAAALLLAFAAALVLLLGHGGVSEAQAVDSQPPTFVSATVSDLTVVITFSENLAAAASLSNDAFTVKRKPATGPEETLNLSSTTAPVISGTTVTLTLSNDSLVRESDTGVKVSYTRPGSGTDNRIEDASGNETVSFTDQPVTNSDFVANSPATGMPGIAARGPFRVPAPGDDVTSWVRERYVTGFTPSRPRRSRGTTR